MLQPKASGFDEGVGVAQVGWDNRVVAFGVGGIVLIVDDTSVLLHVKFVAIIVGHYGITLRFGEIMRVDPEIVVERPVVLEHAWRQIRVDGERNKEAGKELAPEAEVEVLLLIAQSHHVAHLRVGQDTLVTYHVAFVLEVGCVYRQTHVELRSVVVAKAHRFMRQSGVAQGAVDATLFFQNLKDGRVKGGGVDNPGAVQEDAVKMDGNVGDEGGINR